MIDFEDIYGKNYLSQFKDSLWVIRNNLSNVDDSDVQVAIDHMQALYSILTKLQKSESKYFQKAS